MFSLTLGFGILIILLACSAEYIDSTLGMGYGTTLTPLLMLIGFDPLQIVPAVLLSELLTGLIAGFTHHSMGNVTLLPRTMNIKTIITKLKQHGFKKSYERGVPLHLKITLVIALCSIVGTVSSVILAVNLPKFWLKVYIGFLVFAIGLVILATLKHTFRFSWKKIVTLGMIASFNKGISGGGYGPVVTGGQLLAGVDGKNAIGITSLAEGLTCMVGVAAYLLTRSTIDWTLAPYLVIGALISVPFSAYTVSQVSTKRLRLLIGLITVGLGMFTLYKVIF